MSYHILIAEDNTDQRRLLSIFLQRSLKNCTFDFVKSGSEVLQHCATNYNMIILDYILPDMTGLDVLTHCHEKISNVPVIVITAYNEENVFKRLQENGATKIITKGPEYYQTLIQVIKNILAT